MKAIKDWLLEKQSRGIKQVRVATVIDKIDESEHERAPVRSNGRARKLDLVGTAEAAAMLGVERPRIGRWKKKGVLPEPVCEIAAGPVWFRWQIEEVKGERERRRRVAA